MKRQPEATIPKLTKLKVKITRFGKEGSKQDPKQIMPKGSRYDASRQNTQAASTLHNDSMHIAQAVNVEPIARNNMLDELLRQVSCARSDVEVSDPDLIGKLRSAMTAVLDAQDNKIEFLRADLKLLQEKLLQEKEVAGIAGDVNEALRNTVKRVEHQLKENDVLYKEKRSREGQAMQSIIDRQDTEIKALQEQLTNQQTGLAGKSLAGARVRIPFKMTSGRMRWFAGTVDRPAPTNHWHVVFDDGDEYDIPEQAVRQNLTTDAPKKKRARSYHGAFGLNAARTGSVKKKGCRELWGLLRN